MSSEASRDRLTLLVVALLLILAPVVILASTLGFLVITGDLVLGRVTPLEFLELYFIELAIVVTFGYGSYRLMTWLALHRLPTLLDEDEAGEDVEDPTADPELDDDVDG